MRVDILGNSPSRYTILKFIEVCKFVLVCRLNVMSEGDNDDNAAAVILDAAND